MPKVFYTQADGTEKAIDGVAGDSVMQTAVRNGVSGIVGQCGGVLSCATCHVFLADSDMDKFAGPSADEDEMLDCAATDRQETSRLSCQLTLQDGIDVRCTIPELQL